MTRPDSSTIAPAAARHLEATARFYDAPGFRLTAAARSYRRCLARYFNRLIPAGSSVLEIGCGDGELLQHLHAATKTGVDLSAVQLARARARMPGATLVHASGEELALEGTFDVIIISDTLNHAGDIQRMLRNLIRVSRPETRLIINSYNTLWRPVLSTASLLGLRARQPHSSWLSGVDVGNLLHLAGWEVIKQQARLLWPIETPVLGPLLNRWVAPFLPWFCWTVFTVARPPATPARAHSVSVVIPARNEAGNIAAAVARTPAMGAWTELIFVEGNSTDETWAEIERVSQAAGDTRRIKTLRQPGRGKGDAVRAGFAVAEGDILMILDADLTMPPEELPKFYEALASGRTEFANGSRLVYPMDQHAMQFLNLIANFCFGRAFSWLLGQPVKDTLCGTKVLSRAQYERIAANRHYFGDFDPFGDFDLLFGADKLNLRITDIPIRYGERTYGSTNISRWKHGWLLLRMVAFAARKLKFV